MSQKVIVGGRIESKEVGGIVTGAAEILDDAKGKKQSVINGETDDELVRLDLSKQDNLTFDNAPTEGSDNPVKSGGVYAADKALSDAIEAILLLIPSAASALNKLVDTAMMNSSISTATATFRGTYNVVTDLELAVDATHEQIAAKLAQVVSEADNNDYTFVQVPVSAESTDIRRTERYKFNGTVWGYEYDLNTSGFTAAQWAAINSGITLALVGKLIGLPTSSELQELLGQKQDTLAFDNIPVSGSANPVKSGGVYSAINDEKTAREQLAQTVTGIDGRVEAVEEVIPAGAAANNKLVANNSMEAYVTSIIEAITASFTIATADGHINLTLTQTNGRVASLTLTSSDIASAQALTALTGRVSTAESDITTLVGRVSTNETDIANLQQLYNDLQQSKPVPVTALPSTGQQHGVIYRLAGTTSYSDYMWNGSTWVLMATYNNAIDPRPKKASQNLVTSGGVFDNMGALDVSELNATENPHTLAQYVDLSAALAAVPTDYQKGGMSIKFVQSSDNTYVQYKYLSTSTAAADFVNIDNWQCDDLTTINNSLSQVVAKKTYINKSGGYIRRTNGQLIENSNFRYTDFIPCLPSQQFYCRLRANSDDGVCFYDIRKEYISGVNVDTEGETITAPANAYYVRASSRSLPTVAYIELVSSDKSLQDIPDKSINSIYELFADNSADNIDNYLASTKTVTYRDLYNAVKAIKLYGFDSTKKHALYVLYGSTNNFSFRIAEYSNGAWSVVYNYSLNTYTQVQEYSFDHTIEDKRVIATIDFRNAIESDQALFQLSSNPMLIFNKNCYNNVIRYIAGQGINIFGNTISVNEEDLPIIQNGEEEYYNISSSDFSYDGYVNPNNGVFSSNATYKCTGYEPVKAGQIFACRARFASAAGLAFYNTDKQYISGISDQGADFNFTVPTNAAFVRISNSDSVEPFALLTNPKNMGLATLTEKFSQYEKPQNIPTRLYPMTKLPCVSFQFDDNPASDSSIVELFESYHKTCAFAFIGSNNNIITQSKRYIDYQNRGFQIMNHSIDGNPLDTSHYTYDTALEAVLTARERIESVGMICNGFVCPNSDIDESFKPILKLAHSYAFTTGAGKNTTINGRNADRCNLHRQTLQGGDTLEELKSFIDNCITNDQIITFCGHSYDLVPSGTVDQFSIAQITALIEYCIEKELAGELYFRGTDDCIKYFFDL